METEPSLQPSSPVADRRLSEVDPHALKAVAALKTEDSQRPQSPLRESSVPVPSTEEVLKEESTIPSKKRPAPAKTKKGTASTVKKEKAPPAKKRKVEPKRADTPSSRASKTAGKGTSAKGTPINSSPAASIRSNSAEPQEEQDEDDEEMDDEGRSQDGDLYCICRKPDNGQFMIGCDGTCDDWFHGKCVGIPERDKNLIDKYICPGCSTAGVGRTTWKRMCRRNGCRQPAKTGKNKSGASGSKYCSEECGVLYFRDMVAKTRGAEESALRRAARKKGSIDVLGKQDDDIGARGGALAAGEVKALLNVSGTAEEFRKLGDGVLSPPATPDGDDYKDTPEYTELEAQELARIETEKENARHRHTLLKDRMKFVTMAKQAASRVATEKELKPKEYCGYDSRIEWSEQQFQAWRNTQNGQQAFELDTLATENVDGADDMEDENGPAPNICDRKKCARHMEWSKLAVDDLRFEMSDNGDRMRLLDRDEHGIKERAALRSKTGGAHEGDVEVHDSEPATKALPENAEVGAISTKDTESLDIVPTVESANAMVVDAA
ncbi:Putative Zinc finger, PHD-type, Zinc finger, FYVE/PHD-type, Zinc finger, RING/FYVE/PHD-type [Septoria linicola]|uniref:Zinc finger, PHD-type, Zinc finger, FYVE/PHD-type, Zinc finger, RING/FYVE/PHD-type n=1 Tax=Septoria linicola TaxID=215465 RepID=A0A9Q9AKE9_9PEZI|nr:putative Zinc finger, PHD-type, Zinc finger, FYVE/PHD-type, Zinc finger, RING/FYVE/PHD-type [Septoria linicola]USW47773.1 Putative Zinc finger, PHD-type, Zinc finger, FYVE/PHD-type, Zinc finger, RING/FYVE/PHD-type [Septoria linicola]